MRRAAFIKAAVVWLALSPAVLGLGGCARRTAPRETPPTSKHAIAEAEHLIVISIDTLRADHLGCYGHPFVKTPHIDALAREGVRITHHLSAAPTTLASHTSLMSGLYPHTHGVARNSFIVPDETLMLAEVLRDVGFATAAVIGALPLHSTYNFAQGFSRVDEAFDLEVEPGSAQDYPTDRAQRRAQSTTDGAVRWLKDAPSGRKFLFVHYFDPHSPYQPPPPFDRMYRHDDLPITGTRADVRRIVKLLQEEAPTAIEEARVLDELYCGEISYTDLHVGRLLEALKSTGLYERCLIVLTADHGETQWEHVKLFNHGIGVYDTELRTPLIIRFPGGRNRDEVADVLASNIDVMPTVLEYLGIAVPPGLEGRSLAQLIGQDSPAKRPPVFGEATKPFGFPHEAHDTWLNMNKQQCIRTETHKLIFDPIKDTFELFDLRQDPTEQTPLDDTSALGDALRTQLLNWREQANPVFCCTDPSREHLAGLEALGYVGVSKAQACNQSR
ncbi:MAG: sulfatase-like hydrolase/transferase [bacterium]|nr:sulfatase-like hydrolase/transferase [bacterium]